MRKLGKNGSKHTAGRRNNRSLGKDIERVHKNVSEIANFMLSESHQAQVIIFPKNSQEAFT
ncbi:MAG: hypothetical protein IKQ95_04010 [Synergistaceae bacterium]|nr:hypothetical protein [Synergistaceae bacterium]